MILTNKTRNIVLADNITVADNFFSRLKGLLGRSNLPVGSGLVIKPCDSIHTFFMRFPIDAMFVTRGNIILKTYSRLMPWRLTPIFFKADFCVELPAGVLLRTDTQVGDEITFKNRDTSHFL